MSRWRAGARERLQHAALELFTEQGFTRTTVAEITARAGLTTRTFFRYFSDKREVLFDGEEELPALVEEAVRDAPADLAPLASIAHGLDGLVDSLFEGRRDWARARRAVVDADEALREREQRKFTLIAEAAERGLTVRGVDESTATVAAQLGITAFRIAVVHWSATAGAGRSLAETLADTLATMREVASG